MLTGPTIWSEPVAWATDWKAPSALFGLTQISSKEEALCVRSRAPTGFYLGGSERGYAVPISIHWASWSSVRRSSELTRNHPGMSWPRMFISVGFVVAIRGMRLRGIDADHGATPLLAAMAMLPWTRKASPPNIFFSVNSGALPMSWRIRSASSCGTHHGTAAKKAGRIVLPCGPAVWGGTHPESVRPRR
jgi:hypothetical protein